jgi:hypothetical protein
MCGPAWASVRACFDKAGIQRYTVQRAGSYFLRLSGTTPAADANAVEPWVRCVVFVS